MPIKITTPSVNNLKSRPGNFIEYDIETKGFGIRVTPSRAKSFILTYRNRSGRQRRYTIGRYPSWSVSTARKVARGLLVRVANGEDPLKDRNQKRTAPTMVDLTERYIEEHLPTKRPSSQVEDRSMITGYILPAMRATKVADVDHAAVATQVMQGRSIRRSGQPRCASASLNAGLLTGTRSAEGIMASGHANRVTGRTHGCTDQQLRREVLTCQPGAVHTWH